jgi:uncharacterized protein with GYD domain
MDGRGDRMLFISLAKRRKKLTKDGLAQSNKLMEQMVKEGIKVVGQYWTMGRYDAVTILEAKDEKACLRALLRWEDLLSVDTLIAIPREEATKLVE